MVMVLMGWFVGVVVGMIIDIGKLDIDECTMYVPLLIVEVAR